MARARAEVQEELAAARAEAEQERARAAEERARLEQELATELARAEEQIAGAHVLGDERVAAAEAQAAEQLAALWEHVQAQNGATAADDEATAVVPADDDVTAVVGSGEAQAYEGSRVGHGARRRPRTTTRRSGVQTQTGDEPRTVARFPERPPRGAATLPPPSSPPLPADWTRPVVVAVLVLATLAFLLVLAGALN